MTCLRVGTRSYFGFLRERSAALDMERNNFGPTDSGMLTSSSVEGYLLVVILQ
jgi:hypothetical protein